MKPSWWKKVQPWLTHRALLLGGAGLLIIIAVAVLAPWLGVGDPLRMVAKPFLWPGEDGRYWLGTDMLGRDLWSSLIHGARVSLLIGALAGAVAAVLGVLMGAVAGYFGGRLDTLLMSVAELFQITPSLIFTIVIVTIFDPSITSIALGIAATSWPNIARIVRSETLRIKQADFVSAARVLGMRHGRVLLEHIVPNTIAPVIALLSLLAGQAILTEAALAFLGLGDPNIASWGAMIGSGRDVLRTAWYMTAVPGLAIFVTVLVLNVLGSGLNDVLNQRRGVLE